MAPDTRERERLQVKQSGRGSGSGLPDGIHTVELVVGDSAGLLRGKRVPATMWPRVAHEGIAMANVIFEWSPNCDIRPDAPYSKLEEGVPDVHLVPAVETLREVPWQPGTARVLCEAREPQGGGVAVDPRRALQAIIAQIEELGYEVKAAVEIEFYLLDPESRRPRQEVTQCYGISHGTPYEKVLGPMRNLLSAYGIPVEACNLEYAPGQIEVNLRYAEALEAADAAVQFRSAVKEIASQHGWLATFMAKPFDDQSGSGLHIHQSLWRDGANAFSDSGRLSRLGHWFVGGMQRHMPALTLFGSPTANGMKRRQRYSFCPTMSSWGGDNRTVGLRVIEGRESAVRIEQRDGSADCNPYLAMAGQLAAGLDGLINEVAPSPRCDGDGYVDPNAEPLASSVPEAIEALRTSELAKRCFNPLLLESFIGFCQFEHDAVYGPVSEIERDRYLEAF